MFANQYFCIFTMSRLTTHFKELNRLVVLNTFFIAFNVFNKLYRGCSNVFKAVPDIQVPGYPTGQIPTEL